MRKTSLYLVWAFLCLHTTISFSQAATDESIDALLREIDAIISTSNSEQSLVLNSADIMGDTRSTPTHRVSNTTTTQTIELTPWEMVHRTMMLQWFVWWGELGNYVTPNMYLGTPISTEKVNSTYSEDVLPDSYESCVKIEFEVSFWPEWELIEETVEDELRSIAKFCAIEHYGEYFEWKEYTTREEMLMLLMTVFEEAVDIPGYFENGKFVFDGDESPTPYSNVSPQAWFAPYINLAYEYMMIDSPTWVIAKEVTNDEIRTMLETYTLGDIVETSDSIYEVFFDEVLSISRISLSE